ncbi:MAG: oxidoreductase [Monoraphidium minutum]|nr:MAG: oxidoreductase [Monoraphidium minutum]
MGRSVGRQPPPGQWPKISRKQGLRAQQVGLGDHLFTVAGVLTLEESQSFIDAAERAGFQHQGSRGAAYGEAYRDNHRIALRDDGIADALWAAGLSTLFDGITVDGQRAVGLNSNIRIYRYTPKQKFGRHIDDSVDVAPGRVTRYTLLVYLSGPGQGGGGGGGGEPAAAAATAAAAAAAAAAGAAPGAGRTKRATAGKHAAAAAGVCPRAAQDLRGGETVFYGDRGRVLAAVAPQPGLALLHLHGEDRCLEHEGTQVLAGTKYVLRSDVVFGAA